ncbi:MAG: lytic transglycosylase domain-containing protein [Clostridia bacterium]|nr:lytic transglycosylase domain-containing protein [Clostridia bacterium]
MAKHRKKLRGLGTLFLIILLLLSILNWDKLSILVQETPYQEIIEQQAELYNLPPDLLAALIKTESNFYPEALSSPGARGLMQIMPETGAWIANKSGLGGFTAERLYEPEYNIQLGSWYLGYLQDEFDHNLNLALAAYNGGKANVEQWLEHGIWDGSRENLEYIPYQETRRFVEKIYLYQSLYRFHWS